MGYTLKEIAERINGRLDGDPELYIQRVQTVEKAKDGEICVLFGPKAASRIKVSRASAFVISDEVARPSSNAIRVTDSRQALIQLLNLFHPNTPRKRGIHERAIVSPGAHVASHVSIGPGAVVEPDVIVEKGVTIWPNVYIGEGSIIGEDSEFFANVTIYPVTRIGKRVRIHGGAVIGSDGFGYMASPSGVHEKIPQVGDVEIGDDVEIGANCTVDRGTMGTTRILADSRIDNQEQIGHNSLVGEHCIIVAQTGISGSVRMGEHCVLAGQVGISDHVELKPGTVVGAQSGVANDIGPGRWLGTPAIPITDALRVYHLLRKLPEIRRKVREIERRLGELESSSKDAGRLESVQIM